MKHNQEDNVSVMKILFSWTGSASNALQEVSITQVLNNAFVLLGLFTLKMGVLPIAQNVNFMISKKNNAYLIVNSLPKYGLMINVYVLKAFLGINPQKFVILLVDPLKFVWKDGANVNRAFIEELLDHVDVFLVLRVTDGMQRVDNVYQSVELINNILMESAIVFQIIQDKKMKDIVFKIAQKDKSE